MYVEAAGTFWLYLSATRKLSSDHAVKSRLVGYRTTGFGGIFTCPVSALIRAVWGIQVAFCSVSMSTEGSVKLHAADTRANSTILAGLSRGGLAPGEGRA